MLVAIDEHRWLHGYDLEAGTFLGAVELPRPDPYAGGDDEKTVVFTRDGRGLLVGACNYVKVWDRDGVAWTKEPATPPTPE